MTHAQARIVQRNLARHLLKRMPHLLRLVLRHSDINRAAADVFAEIVETFPRHLHYELRDECKAILAKRSNFEPLLTMPPARRAKKDKQPPLTLVERRAAAAKRKVEQWSRKSKLAATKVKAYRRKLTYYKKKGVIA